MEIEYKWDMPDASIVEWLLARIEISTRTKAHDTIHMSATYYDTPRQDVYHMGGGLRIRRENGQSVCCLKLSEQGADGCKTRREYEVEAEDILEGLRALPNAGAPRDACELILEHAPEPTCATDFTREAYMLDCGGFSAELAIDSGEMSHDGRLAPISEIELEFIGGSQEAFHDFALALEGELGLQPQSLSKLARAVKL